MVKGVHGWGERWAEPDSFDMAADAPLLRELAGARSLSQLCGTVSSSRIDESGARARLQRVLHILVSCLYLFLSAVTEDLLNVLFIFYFFPSLSPLFLCFVRVVLVNP